MTEIKPGEAGLVRTVTVATGPRKKTEPTDTLGALHSLDIGVKRLVSIVPAQEEISEPTDSIVG